MTRTETARVLRYASISGVRKLVSRGLLTPHIVGGRHYYAKAEVERLRDSRRHGLDGPGRWPASDPSVEMHRELDAMERELAAARRRHDVAENDRRRASEDAARRLRETRDRITRIAGSQEREHAD